MVLTCGLAGLAMASLCAASLIVVDGYSALSLALLRSNVVIPCRAAAGPHCRTAGWAKGHLRCCVDSVSLTKESYAAQSYASIGRRSTRHEICIVSLLCFDMPLSAQFIGDISLIPKRAG